MGCTAINEDFVARVPLYSLRLDLIARLSCQLKQGHISTIQVLRAFEYYINEYMTFLALTFLRCCSSSDPRDPASSDQACGATRPDLAVDTMMARNIIVANAIDARHSHVRMSAKSKRASPLNRRWKDEVSLKPPANTRNAQIGLACTAGHIAV